MQRPRAVFITPELGKKRVPGKIKEPHPIIEPITRFKTSNFDSPFTFAGIFLSSKSFFLSKIIFSNYRLPLLSNVIKVFINTYT